MISYYHPYRKPTELWPVCFLCDSVGERGVDLSTNPTSCLFCVFDSHLNISHIRRSESPIDCVLPNRINIAPFCRDCCHPYAGLNAQGRTSLGSGVCLTMTALSELTAELPVAEVHHVDLSGPWRLESQNPKVIIPLSGVHIWKVSFLGGSRIEVI